MSREPVTGGPDVLLALYYGGGTGGLFAPIGPKPEDDGLEVDFCEAVVRADPDYVEALTFLGNTYTRRGEHERGLELDLRLVRLRPRSARAHYNVACSHALLGRPDAAFASLERALECDFDDVEHLKRDEDLESLRDDPRFRRIVRRAKARRKLRGES